MSTLKTPFRYDFVGSFLRPEKLKAAKKAFEGGTITQEELDRVTDACVTEIVAKQKVAGYHAITDGEFRRSVAFLKQGEERNTTGQLKLLR